MNILKSFILTYFILASTQLYATDLTPHFHQIYEEQKDLSLEEQRTLQNYDIYFIPGIMAESFIATDTRSDIELSLLTKEYFESQLKFLQKKYNILAQRLSTSSKDVDETRHNIRYVLEEATRRNRKVLFISHSLGGLALLEELIDNKKYQSAVAGISFMQSPFRGSPLAELVLEDPFRLEFILKPIFPYLNMSEDTFDYLTPKTRTKFMNRHRLAIKSFLRKIPVITVAGVTNDHPTIFKGLADIMAHGCLKKITSSGCLTEIFYKGPYDLSDGMVPLQSSFLEDAPFIKLDKVDHGELVLKVPFENYSKEHLTTTLLRMMLKIPGA